MEWAPTRRRGRGRFILTAAVLLAGSVGLGQTAQVDPALKQFMAARNLYANGLFAEAAEEYAAFLKANPNHAEARPGRFDMAMCQYQLDRHGEALAALEEVLKDKAFGRREDALAVQADCLLAVGKHAEALAACELLRKEFPAGARAEAAAMVRLQALYLLDRPDETLQACGEFLKAYPQSPSGTGVRYFLALSQRATKKYAGAATTLQQLVAAHPNSPYSLDAGMLLGLCLEEGGKTAEAVKQFRALLKSIPPAREDEGRYRLGVALYKAGTYAEAAKELQEVVTKHAKGRFADPARLQLGLAQLAAGDVPASRKTLLAVVASDKNRAETARYWLAQCDRAEKKYAAAQAALEQLAQARPAPANLPDILYDLPGCLLAQDKHTEAAAAFADFRQRFPKDPRAGDAVYRQAFCLHKLGQYAASEGLCREAASAPDVAAQAAELSAENLFLLGKYPEAAKAYQELAKTAGDERRKRTIALRLGQCAFLGGDYAGAIERLKPLADDKEVQADKDLRQALFVLGDAQLQADRFADAAGTLARYVPLAGDDKAEAVFKLGLAQLRSGKDAEAGKTFGSLLTGTTDSPWVTRAAFQYGQLAYRAGEADKAGGALQKVLAAKPPADLEAGATYFLAWIDFDAGRFEPAAKRFAELAARHPKHAFAAESVYQEAVCLSKSGKAAESLARAQAYLKADPKGKYAAEAQFLTGRCLASMNKHAEAAQVFSAVAGVDGPLAGAALYELAWAHQKSGKPADAIAAYRALIAKYPTSPLAVPAQVEQAELLYAAGDFAGAAKLLEAVLAAKTVDPASRRDALHRLGWCRARMDDHAKAAEAFGAFLKEFPKDERAAVATYQAGYALALAKQYAPAEAYFAAFLKDYGDHELGDEAMIKLGEVQASAGGYDRSRQTYEGYLQKAPKGKYAYLAACGIGWALQNTGKLPEARTWYAKVTATHNGPTAARAQFLIGETWLMENKPREAVKAYLAVEVYAYPDWAARALLGAGRAFEAEGDRDNARKQYARCVAKYKGTPEATQAAKTLEAWDKEKR